MPLQILKHKSWHVWRRDNIERVEKDEREFEAAQIEHRTAQRQNAREERLAHLRSVATGSSALNDDDISSQSDVTTTIATASGAPGKHVVLFAARSSVSTKTTRSRGTGSANANAQAKEPPQNPDELGQLLKSLNRS
jgi:hypothetical protein